MAIHNFQHSLGASLALESADFWQEVYRNLFPKHEAFIRHSCDGDHQRLGIDTTVIMENSKTFTIDEKIRYKDYRDILLEEYSDVDRNVAGWVVKPLLCDYILFAILPAGKAYLLPTRQLQQAWRTHGQEWKATRRAIVAHNKDSRTGRTWKSVSWGIEPEILFPAIGGQLRTTFEVSV